MHVSVSTDRMDGEAMKMGQAGLGLIQVMLAISAAAGLTYVILQQSDITSKQQAKLLFEQSFQSQVQEIQSHLAKYENCTATLQGMSFTPVEIPVASIREGFIDPLDPENIIPGPERFTRKTEGTIGAYIKDMGILSIEDGETKVTRDVLRVQFVDDRTKALGATTKSFDFYIESSKNESGEVLSCFGDRSNAVANTCNSIVDAVWNAEDKKCELPKALKSYQVVPVYTQPNGEVGLVPPEGALLSSMLSINGLPVGPVTLTKSCQCSQKRCSRVKNCRCAVPACPPNYKHIKFRNWDRQQGPFNKACMYGASCLFVSQPAGFLINPDEI